MQYNPSATTGSAYKFVVKKKTLTLHGKPFTITSFTPKLNHDERENRKKEAESGLYDVFSKYRKPSIRP